MRVRDDVLVKLVADYECHTGENPLWHSLERRLYWVDIPRGRLFHYDPATGHHEQLLKAGKAIGGFTVQPTGGLLLFMARGRIALWREGELTTLVEGIPAEGDGRFNDVIADPEGRVYGGTMPTEQHQGRLYRVDRDRTLTRLLDDVRIANGMGFTPDTKTLYFTETKRHVIYAFDYDRATGALTNQRPFVHTEGEGAPDGLAVDAEGYVWSARYGDGVVVRYTPRGEEEYRIPLPVSKVTSLAFGGPDLTDVYVTTAGGGEEPNAGALFHFNVGVRGRREFFSRVEVGR